MNYCYSQQLGRNLLASRSLNPLSLSPALWLDASDSSTLFNATTGGSLPADGQAVARWEDKSGNSRHVIQGTGVSQPLRKTSIQNSKDAIRFDGANDELVVATTIQPRTVITVQKTSNTAKVQQTIFRATALTCLARYETTNILVFYDSLYIISAAVSNSTTLITSCVFGNSSANAYSNGSLIGTDASGSWTNLGAGNFYVGGFSGSEGFEGDFFEILVFPTVLSNTDRQAVEAYLNAKWAVY